MALNPRVSKAFNAMKVLGIPKETIKPVLKNLLKLYDNNWELIEDDNYRTLADAIFESADEKKWADEQKDGMENDGSEPPLKKLRLEQLKDQVSPRILNNVNTILDLEDGEEKQTSRFPKLMESSQSCIKHRKTESNSHCLPMVLSNKGKDPISSDVAVKVTKSSSQRASTAGHSNQLKGGTSLDDMLNETANKDCYGQNFVVPKRKRPVTDGPHLALSTSVVCSALPGTLEGSSTGNSSADLASPFVTKEDITSACISGAISPSNLEIASSPSGEVKIFLVFQTDEGKGWGVRTLQDLPKGSFVCEYVGEILTNMELFERNEQSSGNERHTYPVLLDADWGSEGVLKDEEALCLDATSIGNVARFINHRCFDANLLDVPVEVETPDHHYYHLAFFTTRKVEAFEELTWDYGIDFNDHSHPIKAFQCCCGSAFCRDTRGKGKKSSVSEVAATSRMVKPSAGCVSKCQES